MSATFSIICPQTKSKIWIGQGSNTEGMRVLYTGEKETMERLKRFLNAHRGRDKQLFFVCDDAEGYSSEEDFAEFEQPEDWCE